MSDLGKVYKVQLNPIKDHEQGEYRPVLVVSNSDFELVSNNRIVVPISSSEKYENEEIWQDNPAIIKLDEEEVVFGFALADQPRTLDLKARRAKYVGRASKKLTNAVSSIVRESIGKEG